MCYSILICCNYRIYLAVANVNNNKNYTQLRPRELEIISVKRDCVYSEYGMI